MPHIIKIEKFEGPLDLLLKLIEAEELDISEVSLAQVTDQYVQYIDQADLPPEKVADFLNIAARLLLIKSRLLLPFTNDVVDDNEIDLAVQLKMYSQFVEVGKVVNKLWKQKNNMYARERLVYQVVGFSPPKNVKSTTLQESFQVVISKIKPILKLPEKTIKQVVSLKEKINYLVELLRERVNFNFHETFSEKPNSTELIVSFLALLELVKQRGALVEQQGTFAEIMIKKFESN